MKILLADDEVSIQKLISGLLEDEGHECVCVEDGTDALEAFENASFDLVILDVTEGCVLLPGDDRDDRRLGHHLWRRSGLLLLLRRRLAPIAFAASTHSALSGSTCDSLTSAA